MSSASTKSMLSSDQRKALTLRSNWPGVIDLSVHCGVIFVLATLVVLEVPFWPLMLLPLGIAQVFLFTLMHETTHATAFKSLPLNNAVNKICALVTLIPPAWFRFFHLAHHRHTQDPRLDPELAKPKPSNVWQYLKHISGIPTYWFSLKTLLLNATGRIRYDYVPKSATRNVQRESQLMLILYSALLLISIRLESSVLLYVWLLPLMLGQPFLRLYLLAEHTGCDYVPDMLRNTRTTLTNCMVRRLAWNMPYHTEHHQMPTIPYHRLADYHQLLIADIRNLEKSYTRFNLAYLRTHSHS